MEFAISIDVYDKGTGHRLRTGFDRDGDEKTVDLGPDEWMGIRLMGLWKWARNRLAMPRVEKLTAGESGVSARASR